VLVKTSQTPDGFWAPDTVRDCEHAKRSAASIDVLVFSEVVGPTVRVVVEIEASVLVIVTESGTAKTMLAEIRTPAIIIDTARYAYRPPSRWI
jgi:hypothetical protein